MITQAYINDILDQQKKFFKTGKTLDLSFRIRQLKRLKSAVIQYEDEIKNALSKDLGRHGAEAYFCDIGTIILEINETIEGLRKWSKPETHFSGITCFPSIITKVYKMPYGNTLIISPFNFPFTLSLGVLIPAIAGGNTAVIKASSKSLYSTQVLKKVITAFFPTKYVAVIDGGHDVADMCLEAGFNKIFYTGSPKVGKHVMEMASKNLTPVALELGGENGNWCIIRKDANLKDAARKIAFFKMLNSGQICININQIAVASEIADRFIELLKGEFKRQIGDDALVNSEYPHLITKCAYDKCKSECDLYKDRVIYGGKGDPLSLRFQPTIIYPVKADEPIVNHELFNPLLPIVPFEDSEVDKLLNTIESRHHGLALYIFTENIGWAQKVMSTMQFGGGCINEVCLHMMVKGVPFGGTGHSGMGAYHGKWGFMEFTHPTTVLVGSSRFNLPLREHPYKGIKLGLIRLFER